MVFNNNLLLGAAGQGGGQAPFDPTLIGNSVWLDGSADYLTRQNGSAFTNRKEVILSFWIQRNEFSRQQAFFGGVESSTGFILQFDVSTDKLFLSDGGDKKTTAIYRDIGWYHILVSYDTSQAVATNRTQLYINGEQVTSFSTAGSVALNSDIQGISGQMTGSEVMRIGNYNNTVGNFYPFNGYIAQACMLESVSIQQGDYSVSDFLDTYTLGTNGSQFSPKSDAEIAALATAAGGNSFCLDFADSSNFGNDISANNNDFTTNSMSSANQSVHTPSKVYATWNPLRNFASSTVTLSEGNLKFGGGDGPVLSTKAIPSTGKWVVTGEVGAGDFTLGVATESVGTSKLGTDAKGFALVDTGVNLSSRTNSIDTNSTSALSAGNKVIAAFDADTGKLWLGSDTGSGYTYLGGGNPATGATPTFTISSTETLYFAGGGANLTCDFGQNNFHGTVPSGFESLNSTTLTAPDYQGIDYFKPVLYTGNGTAIGSGGKAVTGVGFRADFTWIKNRNAADSHILTDVVRGVTKYISSNSTAAEATNTESLSTFDTDGFTVGNLNAVNTNTENYVSWNWLAGGTGSSNTNGSINSTVTVADAGHFSIGTYTGTGAAGTVGHGLPGAPEWYAVKNLTDVTAWLVGSAFINGDQFLELQATKAVTTNADKFSNYASATVLNIGNNNEVNGLNDSMSFMAFRSVAGVCKVGSYTGNGNADGPYIDLGFKPAFFLQKKTSGTADWYIHDSKRNSFNVVDKHLRPSTSAIESTFTAMDFLSNGVKIRTSNGDFNTSTGNYIYLAMADIGGNGTLPPVYGR